MPVKLLIAIVQDQDVDTLMETFAEHGYQATKLASTGGFMRQGNTTLLAGVETDKVDEVIGLIKEVCQARRKVITPVTPVGGGMDAFITYPVEVTVGGANIFVVNIEQFFKI